jgi:hypothetical protein
VSVNLPTQTGHKAEDVEFKTPTNPFKEMKSPNTDRAWISDLTGNTISYLSDCKNPADPSIEQIQNDTLSVLNDLEILFTQKKTFNSREAVETMAQGFIDGVAVKMKLLTFKKNSCSYSLVYGGVKEKFEPEIKHFNLFVSGFKAP